MDEIKKIISFDYNYFPRKGAMDTKLSQERITIPLTDLYYPGKAD